MLNTKTSVLIVVDMQNDFMPQGALSVPHADEIIEPINHIATKFQHVILTQDWHPQQHISFADNHQHKLPFEQITLSYGHQVLWPRHCVQGTFGAEFHQDLNIPHAELIIRKGFHATIDSYSAFVEADKTTLTGLAAYLRERNITTVYLAGVATDFCVLWTALDAKRAGFETYVIADVCKAINLNGSLELAWQSMLASGIYKINSDQLF